LKALSLQATVIALAVQSDPTLGITYKCQAPNGHWSYQDHACPIGSPKAAALPEQPGFEPTAHYRVTALHGFRILIAPGLDRDTAMRDTALEEIDDQLGRIANAIPPAAWSQVQKIPLWIEANSLNHAARFNTSADWLRDHGLNPDKTGGVEITNTRLFVDWSRQAQPWMVLHELAHGYHFVHASVLSARIQATYESALRSGKYERVDYCCGPAKRAHALNDAFEYFAELTEAYFGRNDFQPFNREQLETFDPAGFEMVRSAWNAVWPESQEVDVQGLPAR
jgi:hypothetical protein